MSFISRLALALVTLLIAWGTIAHSQIVTPTSDLVFPQAVQGDSSFTVPPGSAQNASNGSFRVDGNANQSFSIILPSAPEILSTAGAGVNTLTVSNFVSNPAITGVLSGTGRRNVFIGATRSTIAINQTPGSYTGSYTVNIIY